MGVKIYDDEMRRAAREDTLRMLAEQTYLNDPVMHPYSEQTLKAMPPEQPLVLTQLGFQELKPARIRISTIKWKGCPCWLEYIGLSSRLPRGRLYVCEDGHWHSAWFAPRNGRSGRWVRAWSVPSAHWDDAPMPI